AARRFALRIDRASENALASRGRARGRQRQPPGSGRRLHDRWRWRGTRVQSRRRAMSWWPKALAVAVMVQAVVQPTAGLAQSILPTPPLTPMYVISDLHF